MINESLRFLAGELNRYLALKPVLNITPDKGYVLGNVSKVFDADANGNNLSNQAIISLVNVEEDRVAKQQEHYMKTEAGVNYKNPTIYLNLYVLFAINLKDYATSLRWLAYTIQFFQSQNVFTPISHPALDPQIHKLVADLHTLNFEQVNHLWSTLGGKYIPSVLYKLRQVSVDEEAIISTGGFIREIEINDRTKPAVS